MSDMHQNTAGGSRVKRATVLDINIVVAACHAMLDEYSKKPFAAKVMKDRAVPVALEHIDPDHTDKVCYISYNEKNEPTGVMLGYIGFYMCSDEYFAADRMFYVFPQHRHGSALRRLLKALEDWAKENDCHAVKLSVLGSRNNDALLKLVERLGYGLHGYEVGKVLK